MPRAAWLALFLWSGAAAPRPAAITGSLESGPGFHVAAFSLPGCSIRAAGPPRR